MYGAGVATSSWAQTLTLAGIIVTALGGYFVARLKASGNVGNTDADRLWEERSKMIVEMNTRIEALTTKLEATTDAFNANRIAHLAEASRLQFELEKCHEDRRKLQTQLRRSKERR